MVVIDVLAARIELPPVSSPRRAGRSLTAINGPGYHGHFFLFAQLITGHHDDGKSAHPGPQFRRQLPAAHLRHHDGSHASLERLRHLAPRPGPDYVAPHLESSTPSFLLDPFLLRPQLGHRALHLLEPV